MRWFSSSLSTAVDGDTPHCRHNFSRFSSNSCATLIWDMFGHPVRDKLMNLFGIPAVKQFFTKIFIAEHLRQLAQYQQMLVCSFFRDQQNTGNADRQAIGSIERYSFFH